MPLFETEALVLKNYNLAEADRIVVFLTREQGIVRGVAKGAKRLNSKFGSTLEIFSTVNLSYFQKDDRELVSIQTAELVNSVFASAARPGFLSLFSYFSDVLTSFLPPHDPHEKIYRMVRACLDIDPESYDEMNAVKLYFELWMLRLGGYIPDWKKCERCERTLVENETATLGQDLNLVCQRCSPRRPGPQITGDHRAMFYDVQLLSPARFTENAAAASGLVADISMIFSEHISKITGRQLQMEQGSGSWN